MTDQRPDRMAPADDPPESDEETSLLGEVHQVEYGREPPPKPPIRRIHKRRKAPEVPKGKPVADDNPSPPTDLRRDRD